MKELLNFISYILIILTSFKGFENINNSSIDSLVNQIEFYSDIDTVKNLMSDYSLQSESEEVSSSGQIQTLIVYDDVILYDEEWNLTLCFTNLGLIGLNYRSQYSGDSQQEYQKWIDKISSIYGEPTNYYDTMSEWINNPVGDDTSILVMYSENEIQISFFADDTGSEIDESYSYY